jgi:hypothetical protein
MGGFGIPTETAQAYAMTAFGEEPLAGRTAGSGVGPRGGTRPNLDIRGAAWRIDE